MSEPKFHPGSLRWKCVHCDELMELLAGVQHVEAQHTDCDSCWIEARILETMAAAGDADRFPRGAEVWLDGKRVF